MFYRHVATHCHIVFSLLYSTFNNHIYRFLQIICCSSCLTEFHKEENQRLQKWKGHWIACRINMLCRYVWVSLDVQTHCRTTNRFHPSNFNNHICRILQISLCFLCLKTFHKFENQRLQKWKWHWIALRKRHARHIQLTCCNDCIINIMSYLLCFRQNKWVRVRIHAF